MERLDVRIAVRPIRGQIALLNCPRPVLRRVINEGPRYTVREISFLGNQVYDNAALSQGLTLKPGEYFDRAKMNADLGYIKDVYGANGYVFADAQPDLQFEIEPGPLDIMYKITEGSQCLVGDINVHIQGESTHTRRTTAINALPFRPGDVIDIRKIRKADNTIKRMGVFNVEPAKGDVPRIVLSPPNTPELGEDGEAVAEGFRRLGLGVVIGMRTWGGEIWLSGANTLSDGGVARAPMSGVYGAEGKWLIEQVGVQPDIVVDNLPHATFNGRDAQLDAAIEYLKKKIAEDPRPVPPPPPYPNRAVPVVP